jgi:alkylation response protein AidB-like acyl-CoA dehydrogenase
VNLIESISDDDPRRLEVRKWIAHNPYPTGRDLALAGYVVPHWPAPYGLDAGPVQQLIIDDELRRANIKRPTNPTGIGWVAPTLFAHGTPEQRDRYLWPALSGEEIWCQLFSEPDAGSDLASLATRAVRDGDDYVINGSKIWTSGAHKAKFGILIARTNPDAPKHKGISFFICPMDTPGIELRDIVDMTTAHSFNQVFFTNVRIPARLRVGEENDGWRLTRVTLSNERVSLSGDGVLWDSGPSTRDLLNLLRDHGGVQDPRLRQRAAQLYTEARILELIRTRRLSTAIAGRAPGPESSIGKLFADEHGARVMEFAKDIVGADGMIAGSGPKGTLPAHRHSAPTEVRFKKDTYSDVEPIWHYGFLFAPALTLGGGTWAVQRNVIGERVLGLPPEPDATRGQSWRDTHRVSSPATSGT